MQVAASTREPAPCGPLKETNGTATSNQQTSNHSLAEWLTSQPVEALETLHWCPEGAVADLLMCLMPHAFDLGTNSP